MGGGGLVLGCGPGGLGSSALSSAEWTSGIEGSSSLLASEGREASVTGTDTGDSCSGDEGSLVADSRLVATGMGSGCSPTVVEGKEAGVGEMGVGDIDLGLAVTGGGGFLIDNFLPIGAFFSSLLAGARGSVRTSCCSTAGSGVVSGETEGLGEMTGVGDFDFGLTVTGGDGFLMDNFLPTGAFTSSLLAGSAEASCCSPAGSGTGSGVLSGETEALGETTGVGDFDFGFTVTGGGGLLIDNLLPTEGFGASPLLGASLEIEAPALISCCDSIAGVSGSAGAGLSLLSSLICSPSGLTAVVFASLSGCSTILSAGSTVFLGGGGRFIDGGRLTGLGKDSCTSASGTTSVAFISLSGCSTILSAGSIVFLGGGGRLIDGGRFAGLGTDSCSSITSASGTTSVAFVSLSGCSTILSAGSVVFLGGGGRLIDGGCFIGLGIDSTSSASGTTSVAFVSLSGCSTILSAGSVVFLGGGGRLIDGGRFIGLGIDSCSSTTSASGGWAPSF